MASLPLTGYRIIDLTRALAGPYCTMILADLGADVIKVESLRGGDMSRSWGPFADGVSVFYLSVNRNKQSLAIDLRTPEGLDIIRRLSTEADAFVENFKPGVTEAMGLGYEQLATANPRLVYASISGFGLGGAYEAWPGFDQIAQGMSGLMSITGSAESGPLRVGLPIADLAAGMWTAIGVLAALLHQRATGLGQRVDTSLLGSLVGMLCVQGQRYLSLGEVATRAGNDHPVLAPYGGGVRDGKRFSQHRGRNRTDVARLVPHPGDRRARRASGLSRQCGQDDQPGRLAAATGGATATAEQRGMGDTLHRLGDSRRSHQTHRRGAHRSACAGNRLHRNSQSSYIGSAPAAREPDSAWSVSRRFV